MQYHEPLQTGQFFHMRDATPRTETRDTDPSGFQDLARQKVLLDGQFETISRRRKTLRERMLEVIREHGTPDHNGNVRLPLESAIAAGDKSVTGYYVRRAAQHTFDEDAARELADRKGILDLVLRTETITYIDQDALWECQRRGLVDEAEITALITTTYTDSLWGIQ